MHTQIISLKMVLFEENKQWKTCDNGFYVLPDTRLWLPDHIGCVLRFFLEKLENLRWQTRGHDPTDRTWLYLNYHSGCPGGSQERGAIVNSTKGIIGTCIRLNVKNFSSFAISGDLNLCFHLVPLWKESANTERAVWWALHSVRILLKLLS